MSIVIDGTGKGYSWQINRRNQGAVLAVQKTSMSFISEEDEEAYTLTTGNLTLAASAYAILWIKATGASKHLHLDDMSIDWNGGSTSHNLAAYVKLYTGSDEPSANNTAVTPTNMWVTSAHDAPATVYKWSESGSGMTIGSMGTLIKTVHAAQGHTPVPLKGGLILPKDAILGITAEGEEAGEMAINLTFWVELEGE